MMAGRLSQLKWRYLILNANTETVDEVSNNSRVTMDGQLRVTTANEARITIGSAPAIGEMLTTQYYLGNTAPVTGERFGVLVYTPV